jgi:AbrB family looped-hinge helix DNA binding protein
MQTEMTRVSEMTRMSENGRIVIPAAIREAMGLRAGDTLEVSLEEDGLRLRTQRQMIARAQAMVQKIFGPGRSLSDELIAERRLEAKREEQELG